METNNWISVKDRLPETEERVLSDTRKWVFYAKYDGGTNGVKKGKWYCQDLEGYEQETYVSFWYNVPELPKI